MLGSCSCMWSRPGSPSAHVHHLTTKDEAFGWMTWWGQNTQSSRWKLEKGYLSQIWPRLCTRWCTGQRTPVTLISCTNNSNTLYRLDMVAFACQNALVKPSDNTDQMSVYFMTLGRSLWFLSRARDAFGRVRREANESGPLNGNVSDDYGRIVSVFKGWSEMNGERDSRIDTGLHENAKFLFANGSSLWVDQTADRCVWLMPLECCHPGDVCLSVTWARTTWGEYLHGVQQSNILLRRCFVACHFQSSWVNMSEREKRHLHGEKSAHTFSTGWILWTTANFILKMLEWWMGSE